MTFITIMRYVFPDVHSSLDLLSTPVHAIRNVRWCSDSLHGGENGTRSRVDPGHEVATRGALAAPGAVPVSGVWQSEPLGWRREAWSEGRKEPTLVAFDIGVMNITTFLLWWAVKEGRHSRVIDCIHLWEWVDQEIYVVHNGLGGGIF